MRYSFFLSLIIGIFSAFVPQTIQARTAAACHGVDLKSTLDDETLTRIRATAADTANSRGRFWKIEKPGTPPSWLIGTIHVADERVKQLSSFEQFALDQAQTVALELVEILDSSGAGVMQVLQNHPEKFTYQEDNVLKNTLPPPQFALFEEILKKRGLSYTLLSRTKPWLIWAMLAVPSCVLEQKAAGELALDEYLGKLAQSTNKEVVGLENALEQLEAIDSLPLNLHVTSIIQAAHLNDRLDDYHETMLALYLDGDIGAIMPTMMALMVRDLEERGLGDVEMPNPADMLSFETILLDERNNIMAERAAPLLEKGDLFIAVGALHLVGKTGLVEQFRRLGYQVTQVD